MTIAMREAARTRRAPNGDKLRGNGKGAWPMPETQQALIEDSAPPYGSIVIPRQDDFQGDFAPAPALAACGLWLIESFLELHHISGANITYLWKKKGGANKGHLTLGKCVKMSGLTAYFADNAEFVIWAAADNCRIEEMDGKQLEALVYHELKHIVRDPETDMLTLIGHDWEGFVSEVERYGQWRPGRAAAQLRLAFAVLA
jgi:hypothetical protein